MAESHEDPSVQKGWHVPEWTNLMPYMFMNLHIEDVYMLDFNEVIADAL